MSVEKLYSLDAVESTNEILIGGSKLLTFLISGSGTVDAQVKITKSGSWNSIQTCVSGTVYSTETGAYSFRFNQTAASGTTVCEVSAAVL